MLPMQCPHSIYVPDSKSLDTVYRAIGRYLADGRAVIYAARRGHGRSTAGIFEMIEHSGMIDDLEGKIDSGALTIVSIESICSRKTIESGSSAMLGRWLSIVSKVQRRGRFREIVVISGDTAVFADTGSLARLAAFERDFGRAAGDRKSLQVICCYPAASVENMPAKYLLPIVSSHICAISSDWLYRKWRPSDVIEAISRGLDGALGRGSGKLVFGTLKLVYGIDERQIASDPELFDSTLRKIVGDGAADAVSMAISGEVRALIQSGKSSSYTM